MYTYRIAFLVALFPKTIFEQGPHSINGIAMSSIITINGDTKTKRPIFLIAAV